MVNSVGYMSAIRRRRGKESYPPKGISEGWMIVPQAGHAFEYRDVGLLYFTLSETLTVASDLSPYPILERRSFTRSDNTLPSNVFPWRWAFAALITAPMAFGE